ATMLPPAQAAIASESSGEAAPSNPQTVPETLTEPDHSHAHESTPPRPTTSTSSAPVNEQEDETMGGSFHTSPHRSTQAPPTGTTSDGAEALDKLTALSSLVSTLVQKVNTQESKLKAHKLLFKEVVAKLVKGVKVLEDKLKGRKRKFVMTDSDKEEDVELDVDPLIKLAQAAATAAAASVVPTGGSHEADIPPSSSIPSDVFADDHCLKIYLGLDLQPSSKTRASSQTRKKKHQSGNRRAKSVPYRNIPRMIDLQLQELQRGYLSDSLNNWSLKRPGADLEQASSRSLKPTEAQSLLFLNEYNNHLLPVPSTSVLQHKHSAFLIKKLWPTGLGSINVFYRKDNSRKCFTSLREILHLVTRADLMTIYGRMMSFYQDTQAAGAGLVLWGDLKVLMDSPEVNDGSDVWKNQHTWSIQSWKLYSFSGVHVLETVSGLILHMFVDKKYPLSVNLIERMLDHQLEICHGTVGNKLTTAVQLIAFLKQQISDSRRPKAIRLESIESSMDLTLSGFAMDDLAQDCKVGELATWYIVPTGRVKVPAGRYVVPTGKDNVIVGTGRLEDLSRAGPTTFHLAQKKGVC
ncbi:hypothetical protein Tco_1490698, partial [Tanacetum coccineum]